MTLNSHFSWQDWERIKRDWTDWWAGEIGRPMVMIESPVTPGQPFRGVIIHYN